MTRPHDTSRIRLGAASLLFAGILFVSFPVVRPFSDASPDPLVIAATFASTAWVVAHTLAMIAFVLYTVGLLGLHICLQESPMERRAFRGLVLTWIGVGLTLPFFGAEAFGLQVIGQEAVNEARTDVLALANAVRFGPGILLVGVGLALVAVGAIFVASAVWTSGVLPRWSGVPLAVGFVLYIPILSTLYEAIRVAHALLIATGCAWIAWSLLARIGASKAPESDPTGP